MKFIRQNRKQFGEDQFRLVIETDDGMRVEGEWATADEPSVVSDAALKAGHVTEDPAPGPGYMLFDPDFSAGGSLWPELMRYEPVDTELHSEESDDEDEDDEEEEDEEDEG